MGGRINVLVTGRSGDELAGLQTMLAQLPGVALGVRCNTNGHTDPLYQVDPLPHIAVVCVGENWEEELKALGEHAPDARPEIVVIGPNEDARILRAAMQAGARDYMARPLTPGELERVVERMVRELRASAAAARGRVTTVMGAKGGAGATVLAANLAHMLAIDGSESVVLIDLDVQSGAVPLYFDAEPQGGLLEALEEVHALDAAALEGHMLRLGSGLRVMGCAPGQIALAEDLEPDRLVALLEVLRLHYGHVVLDLPRILSQAGAAVLEHSDQVLLVLEQSVSHLRESKRIVDLLTREIGVPVEHLGMVINRFNKKAPVTRADVEKAFPGVRCWTWGNDYERVAQSVNTGVPLREGAKGASVTKELRRLAEQVTGVPLARRRGLFGHLFGAAG